MVISAIRLPFSTDDFASGMSLACATRGLLFEVFEVSDIQFEKYARNTRLLEHAAPPTLQTLCLLICSSTFPFLKIAS